MSAVKYTSSSILKPILGRKQFTANEGFLNYFNAVETSSLQPTPGALSRPTKEALFNGAVKDFIQPILKENESNREKYSEKIKELIKLILIDSRDIDENPDNKKLKEIFEELTGKNFDNKDNQDLIKGFLSLIALTKNENSNYFARFFGASKVITRSSLQLIYCLFIMDKQHQNEEIFFDVGNFKSHINFHNFKNYINENITQFIKDKTTSDFLSNEINNKLIHKYCSDISLKFAVGKEIESENILSTVNFNIGKQQLKFNSVKKHYHGISATLLSFDNMLMSCMQKSPLDTTASKKEFSKQVGEYYFADLEQDLNLKSIYLFYAFGIQYYPNGLSAKDSLREGFVLWLKNDVNINDENLLESIERCIFDSEYHSSTSFYEQLGCNGKKPDVGLISNGLKHSFLDLIDRLKDVSYEKLIALQGNLDEIATNTRRIIKKIVYPKFRSIKLIIDQEDLLGLENRSQAFNKKLIALQKKYFEKLDKRSSIVNKSDDIENLLFYLDFKDNFKDIRSLYEKSSLYGMSKKYFELDKYDAWTALNNENSYLNNNMPKNFIDEKELKIFEEYYSKRNDLIKDYIDVIKIELPDTVLLSDDEICKKIIIGARADNTFLVNQAAGKPFNVDKGRQGFYLVLYHAICGKLGIDDSKDELYPGYWQALQPLLLAEPRNPNMDDLSSTTQVSPTLSPSSSSSSIDSYLSSSTSVSRSRSFSTNSTDSNESEPLTPTYPRALSTLSSASCPNLSSLMSTSLVDSKSGSTIKTSKPILISVSSTSSSTHSSPSLSPSVATTAPNSPDEDSSGSESDTSSSSSGSDDENSDAIDYTSREDFYPNKLDVPNKSLIIIKA